MSNQVRFYGKSINFFLFYIQLNIYLTLFFDWMYSIFLMNRMIQTLENINKKTLKNTALEKNCRNKTIFRDLGLGNF